MIKTCENCKYEGRAQTEQPCCSCIHNAVERFEPKESLWISVKHRIPKQGERVLITYRCVDYKSNPILVSIGFMNYGKWFEVNSVNSVEVYAWRPLPEPHKGSED